MSLSYPCLNGDSKLFVPSTKYGFTKDSPALGSVFEFEGDLYIRVKLGLCQERNVWHINEERLCFFGGAQPKNEYIHELLT